MERTEVIRKEVTLNLQEIKWLLKVLDNPDPDNLPPGLIKAKLINAIGFEDRIEKGSPSQNGRPTVIIPASYYSRKRQSTIFTIDGIQIYIPNSICRTIPMTGKIEVEEWFFNKEIKPKIFNNINNVREKV